MRKYVFFRNDDVRQTLDKSLLSLTDIFIKSSVPLCLAVEPANVSKEVIDWLIDLKTKHTHLIEIIQHGYNHNLNVELKVGNKIKKGEFGGDRSFLSQKKDIEKGFQLMNAYFGDKWFHAFSFPYGQRNMATLKALSDLKYKVINGSTSSAVNYQLFYFLGRILRKEMIQGRKISWNLRKRKPYDIFQIDFAISPITKYYDENVNCEMYNLHQLKNVFINQSRLKNIGIILHHRYHNSPEKLYLIESFIQWLKKDPNVIFCTQETLYNLFYKP